jgi:hypothetical protein
LISVEPTQTYQELVNVTISGGLTPSFTSWEAQQLGAKIIGAFYPASPVTTYYEHKYFTSFLALQWFTSSGLL